MCIRQLDSVAQAVNFVQLALQSKPNSGKENMCWWQTSGLHFRVQIPALLSTPLWDWEEQSLQKEGKAHLQARQRRTQEHSAPIAKALAERRKAAVGTYANDWKIFLLILHVDLFSVLSLWSQQWHLIKVWRKQHETSLQIWEGICSNIYHHQWQNLHKMTDSYFAVFNMKVSLSRA